MTPRRRRSRPRSSPRRYVAGAAALGVLTVLGGASGAAAPAAAPGGKADWTMMVYAVGDTAGVPEVMMQNLSQLAALPDADNVNVVVLLDLPERNDPDYPRTALPGVAPFTTAKLLELDGNRFNEVRDYGELALGRPDVLAGFIEETAGRYPAEKYGLSLFDHGSGVGGGYIDEGPPGTTGMSIPDIRAGMAAGMARAGIDRFELLYHAACLMSSYETVSALAPLAKVMAGSEEIMIKWPLSVQGFPPLRENATGQQVGEAFIDGYRQLLDDVAKESGGQPYRDLAAMSIVAGDPVKRLDNALEAFSKVAVAHMDDIAVEVARARADALEFVAGFPGQGESWDLVDLGDFLRHLDNVPPEVEVARDAAYAALKSSVTGQVTGRATEQATGLNVFLPTDPAKARGYVESGTAPRGWGEFVTAFLEAGVDAGTSSGFGFTSEQAKVLQEGASGIKIAGQLTSDSLDKVTQTETQVYTRLGNTEGALALALPGYLNAGGQGQVQGVWNYAVTTLSDGRTSVPATTAYQVQSGGLVGDFLAQYTAPGGAKTDIGVRVLLSSEGQIIGVNVVDLSNGSAAGIELQNGGTVTPYLFVPGSGGLQQVLSSQSLPVSDRLVVDFERLATGTPFQMAVLAIDVGGNVAAASVDATVK